MPSYDLSVRVNLVAGAILISGHPSTNTDIDVVEVVVGGEVVGHVGQDHCILKQREDGVHARLTVGVVPLVAVHGDQDGCEVGKKQILLVMQGLAIKK